MKIYRFVPDGLRFRPMQVSFGGRFWPSGIDLGRRPAAWYSLDVDDAWAAGNHYHSSGNDPRELADIVATTIDIVVIRGRALPLVPDLPRVAVTVDGEPAFALQLPVVADAVDVAASSTVDLPDRGGPLFWNRIAFRADVAYPDLFWLKERNPLSYVFLTERFLDQARALDVTGLAEVELVWDGAPVPLAYPPSTAIADRFGYRYALEHEFLAARAQIMGCVDYHPVLSRALAEGKLPIAYPKP